MKINKVYIDCKNIYLSIKCPERAMSRVEARVRQFSRRCPIAWCSSLSLALAKGRVSRSLRSVMMLRMSGWKCAFVRCSLLRMVLW